MAETELTAIMSGGRRGAAAALARAGLRALAAAYGGAVRLRNRSYDRGWKRTYQAPVPVVSVGNVTTGGTGKTPLVAWLAAWFSDRGIRPALLSRGYRAMDGQTNDEKLVLDRLCPDVPHLQNADRVASAHAAVEQHGAQVLILDDGFQHRRLARDLDIVLIDALNPWGYGYLLPRGLLREPLSALGRADIIVLTRADQCEAQQRQAIRNVVARWRQEEQFVEVAYRPTLLIDAAGATAAPSSVNDLPITAFCGIGNPQAFRQTLINEGYRIASFHIFPDHHHYSAADLEQLAKGAQDIRAAGLVTTEKDLVKIGRTELGGLPLWALRIAAQFFSGESDFHHRLEEIAARCRRPAAAAKSTEIQT